MGVLWNDGIIVKLLGSRELMWKGRFCTVVDSANWWRIYVAMAPRRYLTDRAHAPIVLTSSSYSARLI